LAGCLVFRAGPALGIEPDHTPRDWMGGHGRSRRFPDLGSSTLRDSPWRHGQAPPLRQV
jgi:hypothetical protein